MPIYFQDLIKFIRTVSRLHLRESDRDSISDFVKRDVPWQAIADLAHIEGVEGFLYRHLKNWDKANISGNILEQLEKSYRQTRDNTLRVKKTVRGFSEWFAELGISTIVLQGLSLLEIYGDPGLRGMADIDFLVRASDKERVKKLLRALGFKTTDPTYPDTLYKKDIWVDLHTHVLNLDRIRARKYLFPKDLSSMWENAVPLFNHPNSLLRLDPFDNFVALSAHALKHSYRRLIWLVDLHEFLLVLVKERAGWEKLIKRSGAWHQERIVLYALILVQDTFNTPIPGWVKRELGVHQMGVIEKHLLRLKLRGLSMAEFYIPLWFFAMDGLGQRVKFVAETLFPRDEIMAQITGIGPEKGRMSAILKRVLKVAITMWNFTYRVLKLSIKDAG